MIKAVMFDFDGTIVNSMDTLADIAADVIFENFGLSRNMARDLYLKTSGLPFCQQMELIFPENLKNKNTVDTFEAIKKESFDSHMLYGDVEDILSYLKTKKTITAVSSNNFQNIIEGYLLKRNVNFDIVLGFGNGLSKGSSHIHYLIQRFNLGRDEIVMVGDSLKDAELALQNGIKFIGKTGINTKQDFFRLYKDIGVVENLSELKEFL